MMELGYNYILLVWFGFQALLGLCSVQNLSTKAMESKMFLGIIAGNGLFPSEEQMILSRGSNNLSVLTIRTKNMENYNLMKKANILREHLVTSIVVASDENNINIGCPLPYLGIPAVYLQRVTNKPKTASANDTEDGTYEFLFSIRREIIFILDTTILLITQLKWRSPVLIYDNSTEFALGFLTKTLEYHGITLVRYNIDTVSADKQFEFLQTIYDTLYTSGINVTVICRPSCVSSVLQKASDFDFTEDNYRETALYMGSQWLIIPLCCRRFSISWNVLHLLNLAFLNIDPNLSEQRNLSISQIHLFFEEETMTCQGNFNTSMMSSSILMSLSNTYQDIAFHQIEYSYHIETLMLSKNGHTMVRRDILPNRDILNQIYPNLNYGFNRRKFIVTTIVYYPFVMKNITKNGTISYYGYCMDLLKELASGLNFTFDVRETSDNEFGALLPNGSWTGMVGLLQSRKVDLAVAPLTIEERREMVMDFTDPFYFDSMTFLMTKPDDSTDKWRVFIDPFHWIVTVSVLLSVPICAFIVHGFERHRYTRKQNKGVPHNYLYALLYLYGALISQGGSEPPVSRSGRIFVSSWWVFSLVLIGSYCGTLVAFMTVTKEKAPINTFDELASQDEYKWGTIGGSIYETLFQNSSNPTFQKIWKGIENNYQSDLKILDKNQDIHIQKVLNEDYAYLFEKTHFEILMRNDCRYTVAEEEYPTIQYGVGLPDKSPYTRLFSEKISHLIESGFQYRWIDKHWPKAAECKDAHRTEAKRITVIDMQSTYYLIAIGITLSLLILCLEYSVYCCIKRCSWLTKNDNTKCEVMANKQTEENKI